MSNKKKRKKTRPAPVLRDNVMAFGAAAVSRGDLLRELGISGDSFESGLPVDPFNPALDGPDWFLKVDEMRRSGGQMSAVEVCLTLPISDAEYRIEGESEELVQLVRENLLEDSSDSAMSTTWPDVMRRAALSCLYGTWCMEKVFGEVNGTLVWRRLADRLPRSITGYSFDPEGGLAGVRQKGTGPDGQQVELELPVDKLLLFPYRKEGDNWHGLSMLRGAYLHWVTVQILYRMANVGIDHSLLGVPVATLPAGYQETDKAALLAVLRAIRRHESSGLVLPPGASLMDGARLGGSNSVDFLPYIEHHDRWLLRTALLTFLMLGDSTAGAKAVADPMIDFALMAWNGLAASIIATINRHGIRKLVMLNAPTAKGADIPYLAAAPLGQMIRLQKLQEFIHNLASDQFLVPDGVGDDEGYWRQMIGLPEKDPRALGAPAASPEPPANTEPSESTPDGTPAVDQAKSELVEGGAAQAFGAVDIEAAVARVEQDLNGAQDAWQQEGRRQLSAMLAALLGQVQSAAGDPLALGQVAVPPALVDRYGAWIAEWLDAAWRVAWETATGQVRAVPGEVAAKHLARGLAVAGHHAEAARFEVVMSALRGESAAAIGARFASTMGTRLRVELADEGQRIAEVVDAEPV